MSQEQARRSWASLALVGGAALLAGCDPLQKPIDLFHGLEGGEIAAERPPPPGAGQPYPHIGTVPDRPALPGPGFRTALYDQLAAERDQKALLAADLPVVGVTPVPAPVPRSAKAAPAGTPGTAAPEATDAAAAGGSNAMIDAADAPKADAARPSDDTPKPPPHDAALQIVGDPADTANLPLVPDAPPPPSPIAPVAASPAPTQHLLPAPLPLPDGKTVYFAGGSDVLAASQNETLRDLAGHRGKTGVIDIIGLGEAESDTPLGQEAAIDLGLRRARAVAVALAALHIPSNAMRVSARPFGRGALVRVLP